MTSSASALLKVELQANGENDSTWGTKANEVFKRLEQAIAGEHAVTLTSSDVTLDDTVYDASGTAESHKMHLDCAGTLTANVNVIVPARTKMYLVTNGTSGAYTVTVKTSTGSGIVVTQSEKAILWCDGTNVEKIIATDDSMQSLLEDTSPQLGGDLDCNGAQIQWSKGADVASGTALPVLTDGNYFDVTGTTTITSIDTTGGAGTLIKLHFDAILTLTHHATNLILSKAANITTAAGDEAEFMEYATGDYICTNYKRAAGLAISDFADGTDGELITWDTAGAPTTVGAGDAAQVLTSNGSGAAPTFQDAAGITLGTPVASTSGTSIDFTSIPSGTKRITITFDEVSTSGASNDYLIQIGDSGGVETTGYVSTQGRIYSAAALGLRSTSGFIVANAVNAASTYSGAITLTLANASTNKWVENGVLGSSTHDNAEYSAGRKALSAELDRVRITTVGGGNTFDAGEINIVYE